MYVLDFSFNFLREDKRNVKKRRKRRPMGTDPETHRSQWDRPRDTQEPMGTDCPQNPRRRNLMERNVLVG